MVISDLSANELAERTRMEDRDKKDILWLVYDRAKTREERMHAGRELGYSMHRIRLHEIWGVLDGSYELISGSYIKEPRFLGETMHTTKQPYDFSLMPSTSRTLGS